MDTKNWFIEVQIAKCGDKFFEKNIAKPYEDSTKTIYWLFVAMLSIFLIVFILDILFFVF